MTQLQIDKKELEDKIYHLITDFHSKHMDLVIEEIGVQTRSLTFARSALVGIDLVIKVVGQPNNSPYIP